MKRFYFILVLTLISTGYLFSQTEENEITDTIIVTKHGNEQEEQTDLSKYNFYNDYLAYLKKNSFIHTDIADTLAINNCEKASIISAKFGSLIFINAGSVTWDIPIACSTTIVAKGFYGGGGIDNGKVISGFGLGIGFVSGPGNIMMKFNIYPSVGFIHTYKKNPIRFGLNVAGDIIIWKVFSIGLDILAFKETGAFLPTIGLNIVY